MKTPTMTRDEATALAQKLWGQGDVAIGATRWRRSKSPRFWVGVIYTDGRLPECKGTSNVDWESAFAIATGAVS